MDVQISIFYHVLQPRSIRRQMLTALLTFRSRSSQPDKIKLMECDEKINLLCDSNTLESSSVE
jgi:hypothetical protein